ncbi:hypothetical protein D3C72_1799870 [compost metagenome]
MGVVKPASRMTVGIQKVSVELAHSRQKNTAISSHTMGLLNRVRQSLSRSPWAFWSISSCWRTMVRSASVSHLACSGRSVM